MCYIAATAAYRFAIMVKNVDVDAVPDVEYRPATPRPRKTFLSKVSKLFDYW